MSKKIKYLLHLLGPIIFIYILFKIDFELLKKELIGLNIYFLVLSAFFVMLQIITRAQKWRAILMGLNISLTRASAVSLYWLGTFVGIITPGKLGEVIKVYFLKNRGQNAIRSFFSILIDRLADVLTLLVLGLIVSLFFLKQISLYISLVIIGVILFLVFIFFLIDSRSFLHQIFLRIIKKFFPNNFEDYQGFTLTQFWQDFKKLKKNHFIPFFFYLIISWLFYFIARYTVVLALGLNLSFVEISAISVLVAIVTMLPISIAGLGTREATVIYLFSLFMISKESALLYSLIIFAIDSLVLSIGLIPYFKESALVNKVKKERG